MDTISSQIGTCQQQGSLNSNASSPLAFPGNILVPVVFVYGTQDYPCNPMTQQQGADTNINYPMLTAGPWHDSNFKESDHCGSGTSNECPQFNVHDNQLDPVASLEQLWQSAEQDKLGASVIPSAMQQQLWKMALDSKGCRLFQKALEDAPSDVARSALASSLRTHIWEALRSPNANHVVQKCIGTMRSRDFQFIIDEILQEGGGGAIKAAQHKFGCRVLQRLFEFSSPTQLDAIVEELLSQALPLCKDMYANFDATLIAAWG
jgi:hypothetical protein